MRTLTIALVLLLAATGCVGDADGDGFKADVDCDDGNASVNTGAEESCNGIDDDCDGITDPDDSIDASTWYGDADNDGYGAGELVTACDAPAGYVADDGDCDDAAGDVFPGAAEEDCTDPTDYNCDGSVGYEDGDADGFAACEDCDDASADVNADADETCNEIDDDCDGETDEDATDAATWYMDGDADTFGDSAATLAACEQPAGYVADDSDCDDALDTVYPGADELCDGTNDEDCDGEVDEADAVDVATFYADTDGDTYGDASSTDTGCTAAAGFVADSTDCDDTLDTVYPGADEVCDGVNDDDCDGEIDEADAVDASTFYTDADADGFGDAAGATETGCTASDGFAGNDTDCDDTNAAINPDTEWYPDTDADGYGDSNGASTQQCETVPGSAPNGDDCDDGNAAINPDTPWYMDLDGDTFGDVDNVTAACEVPEDHVADATDCDDDDAEIYPGAPYRCDMVDTDCDDVIEETRVPDDYALISEALVGEGTGARICVAPGTYVDNIDAQGLEFDLQSLDGADTTIIDGGAVERVLLVRQSGARNGFIKGFTLTNGLSAQGPGLRVVNANVVAEDLIITGNNCNLAAGACKSAAVHVLNNADVTFRNLLINDNVASGRTVEGSGIMFHNNVTADVENTVIVNNQANGYALNTSAVHVSQSDVTLTNVVIAGNIAQHTDGGAAGYSGGINTIDSTLSGRTLELTNVTIHGNMADSGNGNAAGAGLLAGGAYIVTMNNTTITDNDGIGANGQQPQVLVRGAATTLLPTFSNVSGSAAAYAGMVDPVGVGGNISEPGGYTDVSDADPNNWDLTLGEGSALIDAGDSSIEDADGSTSDIGAYGGPGGDSFSF